MKKYNITNEINHLIIAQDAQERDQIVDPKQISSKSFVVEDFKTLQEALTSKKYENINLNIKSDITLTDNIILNENIKYLFITGNNHTINGQSSFQFLNIKKDCNLTVNNLIINNCYSENGGAIKKSGEGILIINNSTFSNNRAQKGGAMDISSNNRIYLNTNIFMQNEAEDAGAIYCEDNEIHSNNSIYQNNKAKNYAGAVYVNGGYLSSKNDHYISNSSTQGGAIVFGITSEFVLDLCDFSKNSASIGGAIWMTWSEGILKDNNFQKNTAVLYGGSIRNDNSKFTLINNKFTLNTASSGGALYSLNTSGKQLSVILANNFSNNKAEFEGGAIYAEKGYINIAKNTFNKNHATLAKGKSLTAKAIKEVKDNTRDNLNNYPSMIYVDGKNIAVNGNIFTDGRIQTQILLNVPQKIASPGKDVIIKGKFMTKTAKILANTTLDLKINNKTQKVRTNRKGEYSYKFKTDKTGTYNVSVSFKGNKSYTESSNTKTFKVQRTTKLTINRVKTLELNDNFIINGKFLKEDGKALINSKLELKVNKKSYTVKTNKKGIYVQKLKADKAGTNTAEISFKGNANYSASTAKIKFTINKKTSKITLIRITDKKYKENVKISGKFTDKNGKALKNTTLNIKVNNKTYKVITNAKGIYNTTVKANKIGTSSITVEYPGNKKYAPISIKRKFTTAACPTKLTIYDINNAKKGNTIIIKGKFTDENNIGLPNTLVQVTVNGKTHKVKTNSLGIYSYKHKIDKIGSFNLEVSYNGNNKYKATSIQKNIIIYR